MGKVVKKSAKPIGLHSGSHSFALPDLEGLLIDPGVRVLNDAEMINAYLEQDPEQAKKRPPISMGIGDPYFSGVTLPRELAAYEAQAPLLYAGYLRTPAGLPEARQQIARQTVQRHGLRPNAQGRLFEVHLTSATGTRGIMGDFGQYLRDKHDANDTRTPMVLCAAPSWDYAGVFEPQGYHMAYWSLDPTNGWEPRLADARAVANAITAQAGQRLALIVVNTQHNPTGAIWSPEVLRGLFELAVDHEAGILLDDPYFFVTAEGAPPVSALHLLLEYLDSKDSPVALQQRWCRTESFGKAFACNDWGIGTVIGAPAMLDALAAYTFRWAFPRGGRRQWAMAQWLADPACDEYIAAQQAALATKRNLWAESLQNMGWPVERTPVGHATPYFLMAVPTAFAELPNGTMLLRQWLLDNTGVLFGYASIEQEGTAADVPYLRAYLAADESVIRETIQRLRAVDFGYDMPVPASVPEAYRVAHAG